MKTYNFYTQNPTVKNGVMQYCKIYNLIAEPSACGMGYNLVITTTETEAIKLNNYIDELYKELDK